MKNKKFNLSDDDVKAISCALEVMPSYGCFETEAEADTVYLLCVSCGKKLIMHEQLSNRETAFIALSIDNAFKALRGEITIDNDSVVLLRPYMFTINKLHPVFTPLLDEIS